VPDVRRAAIAAGRGGSPRLVAQVIENLGHPAYAGAAAAALASLGAALVPTLSERFIAGGRRPLLVQLARVLGQIGGERARGFLRAQLDYPDEAVRSEVASALLRCGYRAETPPERVATFALLRQEAQDAAYVVAAACDLPEQPVWHPLKQALRSELRRARQRCFELLTFVYDREAVLRARDNVASRARDKRAYAVEVLDVMLDGALKGFLLPLLDERPDEQCREALAQHFPQPQRSPKERVRELLARPERSLRAWTRACAARAAAELFMRELLGELLALQTADPLLRQTVAAAVERLKQADAAGPERSLPMLLIEKVMMLKGVQMFEETSEEILAEIAAALEELELPAGEIVFRKGDAGDSMYVIVEGQVRVFDGERTINVLGEREIFGELALLDPEPRSASCAAQTATRLFRLDSETFSQLMAGNIEIVRGILHVLCERLRRVTSFASTPR
jgi:cyclic nucleotide-binding protein